MMELPAIIGIIAAANVINNMISTKGKSDIEPCVSAFYADTYNGDKFGDPTKTFFKCMQTNFSDTFKEVKERYKPVATAVESQ